MLKLFILMIGGAIGTGLRYISTSLTHKVLGYHFPWGTLAVNLSGCFLIGIAWALLEEHHINLNFKLFLFTGIFGGYTTFSAFAIENVSLVRGEQVGLALVNILATNILGLALVFAGFYAVKFFTA